jgi:hypothetical protein
MRVTISHNKSQQDVVNLVDRSMVDVFKGLAVGPVQVVDPQKSWNGNVMTFSLVAKAGFLSAPIQGTVTVTDKDVTIDADLGIFDKLIPEEKAKTALASRIKGLLTSGES